MFKISRKQTIIRASILGSLVIAILSMATFFIVNNRGESHATTQDGASVSVDFKYGSEDHLRYGSHMTHWYEVTSSGDKYNAYCAQPEKGSPAADGVKARRMATSSRNNKIKLITYLREYDAGNDIFNAISGDEFWGTEKQKYVFAHVIIGVLYENLDRNDPIKGLENYPAEKSKVWNAIDTLQNLIDNNSSVWQAAQNFILFRTDGDAPGQIVVWIEPSGSIIVEKADFITKTTTPQGDADFNGITFTVYDGTTPIASASLEYGATSVTFRGLDIDKSYLVTETINGNTTYTIGADPTLQADITSARPSPKVTFENNVKNGNLKVKKVDKETGKCDATTYGRSFAGTTIQLFNKSAHPVVYNGITYNPDPSATTPMATKSFAQNQCDITFDNLPYGTYGIKETSAAEGYVLDGTVKDVTVHPATNGETVVYDAFLNQPIRGDIRIIKTDPANNMPMANTAFNISALDENNHVMESHIVLADENGIVDTSASVALHTNNTNGYDEIFYSSEDPVVYAGYGTWFGKDTNGQALPPNDNLGALPYGTYLIEELTCDANKFCYNIVNEKMTKQITQHNQLLEIDWDNDCAPFSIQTEATDKADGDHYIEVGQETEIKDHVAFCAKKNFTFTITGTLMKKNKTTGEAEPFLVDGQPVEQSVTIKPEEDCGTVDMYFPVNTSDIAGESIVVFEKLYYKDNVKSVHEDINDPNQTIDIVSLGTVAVDNSDDDKLIIPSEETVIKDTVSYCAPIGEYTIKGILMDKSTGSPILVNEEPVTGSVTFTSEQNCGTVEMVFPAIDTTTIAGHPIVVFETLYSVNPAEPTTLKKVISHEDLNDEDQTVYPISISTTVQPNETGTKVFPLNSDVTVTDMVHYCLQPGLEYTVKGVVMDKSTGNGLLVDSQPVEQSVTFTPTEYCGEFPMYYTFNTRGLTGAQLVIFETLYYNDETLIEHKDINNELESFEIDIEAPETGYAAKMSTGTTDTSHIELLFISAFAMAPVVVYSASHILAKRKITFRK